MLIKTFLNHASEYRGKGIDFRSVGGNIVAPHSRRDGKGYEILKDDAPIAVPSSLSSWLVVGTPFVFNEKLAKQKSLEHLPLSLMITT